VSEHTDAQAGRITLAKAAAICAALVFLYAGVLAKLGRDWWSDENYSHGLLVPFVIGLIVWYEWELFERVRKAPSVFLGALGMAAGAMLLLAGTLGSELFTARISLVVMLAGLVLYLFGRGVLNLLVVPAVLLLLAIPIPQIIFNRVAFPLQLLASKWAVWGIRALGVPALRNGNVIDILPAGSTQTISLEVVEACSGIRSLMTLVTLALVLGYFTRGGGRTLFANFSGRDLVRTALLMLCAVPIAVVTNAGRVAATGYFTYGYGKAASEGTWHDASGWLVYIAALAMLFGANVLFRKLLGSEARIGPGDTARSTPSSIPPVLPVVLILLATGLMVNWFSTRPEAYAARQPLGELPARLGEWSQRGSEIRFDEETDRVLGTTDYTMREYTLPSGRIANIYVGYYESQRSGATYHSPQNCLPGAGWVMKDPQRVTIRTPNGRMAEVNKYTLQNGIYNEVMLYWYQGRGRLEASEYADKMNTVWDSLTKGRSDGAMVRVMTSIAADDETSATAAAVDLAERLASELPAFIPE
jgi:exosortase D (VPLPA-CTERM-specific)